MLSEITMQEKMFSTVQRKYFGLVMYDLSIHVSRQCLQIVMQQKYFSLVMHDQSLHASRQRLQILIMNKCCKKLLKMREEMITANNLTTYNHRDKMCNNSTRKLVYFFMNFRMN